MLSIDLDIRTLSFVTVLFTAVFGIGLLGVGLRLDKHHAGISCFAIGCLSLCLGFLLFSQRGNISDFLSVVMANALILGSFVLMTRGLAVFRRVPVKYYRLGYPTVPILLVFFIYYTFVDPDVCGRIVVVSLLLALQTALGAISAVQKSERPAGFPEWMMGVVFVGASVFQIAHAGMTINGDGLQDYMTAGTVHQMSFVLAILVVSVESFGMLWLLSLSLEHDLRDQMRLDVLTEIYNRRALNEFAPREMSRAVRHGQPLSLVMIDIDHFKKINDTYGHSVGDQVLAAFAEVLRKNVRSQDYVVRYGGEEFLLLLPETNAAHAEAAAEKIRGLLKGWVLCREHGLCVNASFGVAQLRQEDTWESLSGRADESLYAAKKLGRDRVVVAA